ncbi:MAG: thiol reductant ABC exporter subunit CydD [Geminicoccaceae bacterium]|nr:thiol reductant ABC exporter subunit CydD [Geminicoccaceae bacterium]
MTVIPQAALMAMAFADLAAGGEGGRVVPAAAGFVLLAIVAALLEAAGGRLGTAAALSTIGQARAALAEKTARISPLDAGHSHSGSVAALGTDKLEAAFPALARFEPVRWRAAVVPSAILLAVFWVSWVSALILLVAGPLIPLFMALVGMTARQASERQLDEVGTMNGALLDRLRGLADLRLLGAVGIAAADFRAGADRLRSRTMEVLRIAFLSSAVLELFSALGVAMVAVHAGFSLLGLLDFGTWANGLSLGEAVFVLMLAPEFFAPLREFSQAWHSRAAAQAAASAFDAEMAAAGPRMLGSGGAGRPGTAPPIIRLRGIVARNRRFPDLVIEPGASLAITGASGAGKSTLLALLAGLLPPDSGRIEVGGRPLDDDAADGWRSRIGWVDQAPGFINGSLRANVALSGDASDRQRVLDALELAAAGDIPMRSPRGLDMRLGETGQGVSGGEARRLAVARAAFRDVDVILADEPTASLDAPTAEAVTRGLLALNARGATLVVATHDLSLAARMARAVSL